MTRPQTPFRDLAIGISVGLGSIGLVFFGTVGTVEVATLIATVVMFIWFATVERHRLTDPSGRPSLMLFGLATMGVAVVFTAAIFLRTLTQYLALLVSTAAFIVGLARALGPQPDPPGREP